MAAQSILDAICRFGSIGDLKPGISQKKAIELIGKSKGGESPIARDVWYFGDLQLIFYKKKLSTILIKPTSIKNDLPPKIAKQFSSFPSIRYKSSVLAMIRRRGYKTVLNHRLTVKKVQTTYEIVGVGVQFVFYEPCGRLAGMYINGLV